MASTDDDKANVGGGSGDGGSKGSWWAWDNLVKVAKEKTRETLEIVKSDFTEFTTTMSADTTNLIHSATAQFVQSSNTATFLLDSFDNKMKLETSNRGYSASAIQDRYENELKALQLSEATYLSDPLLADEFAKWQEAFDPDANKAAISELLIENSSMRLIYSKLVPAQISNDQFWCRYFFKANVFEEEHRKRIKLLERVKDATAANKEEQEDKEGAADWDEDENEDLDEKDKTINNSGESMIEKEASPDMDKPSIPTVTQSAQLLIEEQTGEGVSEIASETNKSLEDKVNMEQETESGLMVSSVKTEDSDDWDKVSDQVNEEESTNVESDSAVAAERKKILSSKAKSSADQGVVTSKSSGKGDKDSKTEENNDDWDDWGE